MDEKFISWARLTSSIGTGLLGLYLIANPLYEYTKKNQLDENIKVERYQRICYDLNSIKEEVAKARNRTIFVIESLDQQTQEQIREINTPYHARIKTLEEIQKRYYKEKSIMTADPIVQEWKTINNEKRNRLLDIPIGLGALIISLGCYPRNKVTPYQL
jgi:hypothetical protein